MTVSRQLSRLLRTQVQSLPPVRFQKRQAARHSERGCAAGEFSAVQRCSCAAIND